MGKFAESVKTMSISQDIPMPEHQRFDDTPQDDWSVGEVANWAARAIMKHEAVCSQRWGVIIRLMWYVLSGIGMILITIFGGYISHLFSIYDKMPHG